MLHNLDISGGHANPRLLFPTAHDEPLSLLHVPPGPLSAAMHEAAPGGSGDAECTRPALRLHLEVRGQVDHGRDRVQALLGRHTRVVRRRSIEPAMRERDGVRKETERRREAQVEERLGRDTPCEDDEDAWQGMSVSEDVLGKGELVGTYRQPS